MTSAADPDRVIAFLHEGGYISGSMQSQRHMIAEAGWQARARTLALGCRLAPGHPFPVAIDDALAGYHAWHLFHPNLAKERSWLRQSAQSSA
jgi:monoterpene epsilon-lactone hydrolase